MVPYPREPFPSLAKTVQVEDNHPRLNSVLLGLGGFFLFLMGFFLPLSIALANIGFFSAAGLLILRRVLLTPPPPVPTKNILNLPIFIYFVVWILAALTADDPIRSLATLPRAHHFLLFYLLLLWAGREATHQTLRGYLCGTALWSFFGSALYLYWNVVEPVGIPGWMSWFGDRVYHQLLYNRYRVSLLTHPMTFAEILLPGFFIFLSLSIEIKYRLRWAWLGLVGLVSLTLLLTQERGPWVGAMLGTLILSASHPRRVLAFVGGALLLLWMLSPDDIKSRIKSFTEIKSDSSLHQRLSTWKTGWYLARKDVFTGVGPGRIKHAMEQATSEPDFPCPAKLEPDLHNVYLGELTAKGIFGLAAVLFLFWRFARQGLSAARLSASDPHRQAVGKGLCAFFFVFPVINLTESALWDAEVALTLWMLAAVAFFLSQKSEEKILPSHART